MPKLLLAVVVAMFASSCASTPVVVDDVTASDSVEPAPLSEASAAPLAPLPAPIPSSAPTVTATPAPAPKWVVVTTSPTSVPDAESQAEQATLDIAEEVVDAAVEDTVEPTTGVVEAAPAVASSPTPVPELAPGSFALGYTVGDCYTEDGWQSQTATACSEPHIAEALFIGELDLDSQAPFPEQEEMTALVDQVCLPSLEAAWASVADTSIIRSAPFWPIAGEWLDGDRSFVCFLAFDTPVDLSLADMAAQRPRLEAGRCYLDEQFYQPEPQAVACTATHHIEIYHTAQFVDPADALYPGTDVLGERAKPSCRQAFESKTGVPLLASTLQKVTLLPTQTWDSGDRTFHCFIRFDDTIAVPLDDLNPLRFGDRHSLFGISRGECLTSTDVAAGVRVFVDCGQPHNLQVVSAFSLDEGPYPGDGSVAEEALTRCQEAVSAGGFLEGGAPDWTLNVLAPNEPDWTSPGGRAVVCFAQSPQLVTTTIAGL